jgi:hypothetical protein
MPSNPKIIEQMRDRQRRMFRIAMDPARYGLTLKVIEADSGLDYDSLRNYAAGKTTMPATAIDSLTDVIPDELLSLLLPDGRAIFKIPQGIDHDDFARWCQEYLLTKQEAHHPNSPAGRDISACEEAKLSEKIVRLPIKRMAGI